MRPFKKITAKVLCAALAVSVLATGCNNIDKTAVVVNINGGEDQILLGYANFCARYEQSIYDNYYSSATENMWQDRDSESSPTVEENIKESVMESIKTDYAAKIHAEEMGISLTEEENAAIEAAADQFMSDNSNEAISTLGATREIVIEYLTAKTLTSKVGTDLYDAVDVKVSDEDAIQSTISYVKFATDSTTDAETGETRDMTEAEKARQLADAQTVETAGSLEEGAELVGAEVKSYTFTAYEDHETDYVVGPEVIAAALGLTDGQTSSVITTDDGYYVVRLDHWTDEEATADKREELENNQRSTNYNDTMTAWKDEIDWVIDEAQWAKVRFIEIFKAADRPVEEESEDAAE